MKNIFWGRKVALGTMHKKETVIVPILEKKLGVQVVVPPNFNTDVFGTFSCEVPRVVNQLQAARNKAKAVIESSGLNIAVASEGSFDIDPHMPFLTLNTEIVVLIDTIHELEIVGISRTHNVHAYSETVSSHDEAVKLALSWDFPINGIIVKSHKNSSKVYKDINSIDEFSVLIKKMLNNPFCSSLHLETDMRAHKNSIRMKNIEAATEDLVHKCLDCCPRCDTPGFVVTSVTNGLPCNQCGALVEMIRSSMSTCSHCSYTAEKFSSQYDKGADPQNCEVCNP